MNKPDNIRILSLDIDDWLQDLKGIRKPRAYNLQTTQGYDSASEYDKQDKLAKNKHHNTYAQLPIKGPLSCVRAITLRDILKLEPYLTKNDFSMSKDKIHLIIKTGNTKYTLTLRGPSQAKWLGNPQ